MSNSQSQQHSARVLSILPCPCRDSRPGRPVERSPTGFCVLRLWSTRFGTFALWSARLSAAP